MNAAIAGEAAGNGFDAGAPAFAVEAFAVAALGVEDGEAGVWALAAAAAAAIKSNRTVCFIVDLTPKILEGSLSGPAAV